MFKSVFSKTIYTKRWMLISWTVGIAALVAFTMVFYPTLSKSFADSLKDAPDSLRAFVGDSSAYATVGGYTDVQIFSQLVFMTLIMGIILFTGVLAGEEGDGTLQTVLIQPIKRGNVYIQKLLAASTLLALTCLGGIFGGVTIGVLFIGEHIDYGRLLIGALAVFLVTMVFSVLGFALGAITGKRGLSGGIAGVFAFTAFLVSTLAVSVKSLQTVDKLSPFHYFNKPGIMQYGPHWRDFYILGAVVIIMAVVAIIFFKRRDIYQH